MPVSTLTRSIHFFSSVLTDRSNQTVAHDVLWSSIAELPYDPIEEGGLSRCRQVFPDVSEAVDLHPFDSSSCHGRIYRTRFADFPLIGRTESDAPLTLDGGEGLRHPSHFHCAEALE